MDKMRNKANKREGKKGKYMRTILILILTLGIHGQRHMISKKYVNLSQHHRHKLDREHKLIQTWDNNFS